MEEVEQICTRIAIMDKGSKIAEGTTEELKRMIKNTETITAEILQLPENVREQIEALEHVYNVSMPTTSSLHAVQGTAQSY